MRPKQKTWRDYLTKKENARVDAIHEEQTELFRREQLIKKELLTYQASAEWRMEMKREEDDYQS